MEKLNKYMGIIKLIVGINVLMFCGGGIVFMCNTYINYYKKNNAVPPFIVESKIQKGKQYKKNYIIIRSINDSYENAFKIEIGQFTYQNINIGDTINNI